MHVLVLFLLLHQQQHVGVWAQLPNVNDTAICSNLNTSNYLCSDEIAQDLLQGSPYYDLERCLPSDYEPGCLEGFFSERPGVRCCPGYYCPGGVTCMVPCSAGGYCPRGVQNETYLICEPYGTTPKPYFGCGGAETNFPCPAGNYCPDTETILPCPFGYYCPPGSVVPHRCPVLAACKRGSSAPQLDLRGLALVLAVLGLLYLSVFLGGRNYNRLWLNRFNARPIFNVDNNEEKEGEKDDDLYASLMEQFLLLPRREAVRRIDIKLDNVDVQLGRDDITGHKLLALNGLTGTLSAGRMTAVMGPSGAGKSVFIHTLAGRPIEGTIHGECTYVDHTNGYTARTAAWSSGNQAVVGFVPQEDIMNRSLTVFEVVDFNAQWRLPRDMSRKQKLDVVFDALETLGLGSSRLMRTRIGDDTERGVSGGERKRVNIAMELVAQPSILLLDEPTSGLDASTSADVVRALKSVAQTGVNVVVVLHQPRVEILRLFDDLWLLAPGGRTVYTGPTHAATAYFHSLGYHLPDQSNPADFFIDVISGSVPRTGEDRPATVTKAEHGIALAGMWKRKQQQSGTSAGSASAVVGGFSADQAELCDRQQGGLLNQTRLCAKRAIIQRTRDLNTALTDYGLMATAGVVLGLLFHAVELDRVPTANSFLSMAVGFAATQQALRLFGGAEHTVFMREADAGINRLAYFLGKNLASLPDLFVLPLFFFAMFYSFSNPRGSFYLYYLLLLAAQFALSGVGHAVSVVLDPAKSQLAAVVLILALNGISGISPYKSELGQFGFVCYTSYGFWLTEALFLVEARHYPDVYQAAKRAMAYRLDYDLDRSLVVDVGVLVAMGVVSRLVCLLVLLVTRRQHYHYWMQSCSFWRRSP